MSLWTPKLLHSALLSPQQRDARVRNVSAAAAVLPDCGVRRVYGHALQQVQYQYTVIVNSQDLAQA